jgi:lysophospholipase L1-like esterase
MVRLILCLFLIACGGGSPEKLIEWYGDSTNVGVDGAHTGYGGQCPCGLTIPPLAYVGGNIKNHSVGGLSAWELLAGKAENSVIPWVEQMAQSKANVVVIAVGIGDSSTSDPVTYSNTLQSLVTIAQQAGKQVVFQGENPTFLPRSHQFAQVMRNVALANNLKMIDVESLFKDLADIPDGIHPNTAAYKRIGEFIQLTLGTP